MAEQGDEHGSPDTEQARPPPAPVQIGAAAPGIPSRGRGRVVLPGHGESNADLLAEPPQGLTLERQAEAALVRDLREDGFCGPRWDRFAEVLAEYGVSIIGAWTLTHSIFGHCRRAGIRGCPYPPTYSRPWTKDEADEIALEVVATGIRQFRDAVLIPSRWSPSGRASLKTFFITQCLFAFPNVYRRWLRETKPLPLILHDVLPDVVDLSRNGDPAHQALIRSEFEEVVANTKNPTHRMMLGLRAIGFTNAEIAEIIETTEKAVECALYRHRRRVRASALKTPLDSEETA
jgi:DNA-directed RNA polymerase specialized sigma24 family protein